MAINSKSKGNTYERKMAKVLSDRFARHLGLENGFVRNVDSGSYFGASNQTRLKSHILDNARFGDIVAPPNFKFVIECKHYKAAPSFTMMVKQECKLFDGWIQQAQRDANNAGKRMAIIAKFNNVPDFVISDDQRNAFSRYNQFWMISLSDWLAKADHDFFD